MLCILRLDHAGREVKMNNFTYDAAIHGAELKTNKQTIFFKTLLHHYQFSVVRTATMIS